MARSKDFAIARFASMSDEELRRVVILEREDYVPYALELAEEELARRESTSSPYRDAAGPDDPFAAPVQRGRNAAAWADVWSALLGMAAIGNVASTILADGSRQAIGRAIFIGAFELAVAIGLRRRNTVAWWFNWFLIAAPFVLSVSHENGFALLVGLALTAPNGYYFLKHRALFGMAQ
jgi:hypothetical protein